MSAVVPVAPLARRLSVRHLLSGVALGALMAHAALAQDGTAARRTVEAETVAETDAAEIEALETGAAAIEAEDPAVTGETVADAFTTRLGRIVLGAGTPRVAIDTPQAVTVLDREDIDRTQDQTLDEVFQGVPGVQATGASARVAGQAINIRGIGNAEQTASESRIIVNVDGAPKFFEQYRTGSFFGDIELYERVEVLRGPASATLYGAGAIGGVVNFETRDPEDFILPGETGAVRMKASYDSNGDGGLGSLIFARQFDDRAAVLAAINYGVGGEVVDGSGDEIPGTAFTQTSGLAKGLFWFGNDNAQSLEFSYSQTDSDLDDTAVAQTGGATVSSFGTADMTAIDQTAILTYGYAPADNPLIDLAVSLSYSDTTVDKTNFSLGSLCALGQTQVLCENEAGYQNTVLRVENTSDLSTGDWQNFVTVGIQGSQQDRTADSTLGALAFHPEGEDDRVAGYLQAELVWNDKLTLIPGLRVEHVEQTPGSAAATAGAEDSSGTAVSPKLAALYQFTDVWGVFGSVAQTERMPTLDELYSSEAAIRRGRTWYAARLPSLQLENETATTWEMGVTFQQSAIFTGDDVVATKLTAFNNEIDDMIAVTPRPTGPTLPAPVAYYSNINEARIWGAELEGAYDSEFVFANLAYSNVQSEDQATGQTLVDTPAENVSLTIGGKLPRHGLSFGWTAAYFAAIETSSVTTSAGAYDVHGLFVSWSPFEGPMQGFAVNLAVENIFDTTYRNNLELDNSPGRTITLALAKSINW